MELEPAANARWHKNQQIEMELRRTVSSVTLNSNPVSDEGVYICAVTHSRIDHSPVVVCVCLGTDFGRLQPALYSGVAHGISEDVHELWVVHRANVNARHRDFLLSTTLEGFSGTVVSSFWGLLGTVLPPQKGTCTANRLLD